MILTRGDKVRYIGTHKYLGIIAPGTVLKVFGSFPETPMKGWKPRNEVSVRVDDPADDFGGAVSIPVNYLEKLTP